MLYASSISWLQFCNGVMLHLIINLKLVCKLLLFTCCIDNCHTISAIFQCIAFRPAKIIIVALQSPLFSNSREASLKHIVYITMHNVTGCSCLNRDTIWWLCCAKVYSIFCLCGCCRYIGLGHKLICQSMKHYTLLDAHLLVRSHMLFLSICYAI